ncbi:MAG: thiolase family protein [Sneathiella sp.]|nr:thiolase family protein [Sneathiella sp.]
MRDTYVNKVVISGVGESEIGRVKDKSGLDLCSDAALNAIANAGLKVKDIDGLLTSYCSTEPFFVFYGALAEHLGLELDYGVTMTAGGGTAGMMINAAAMAIASGVAKNILIVAGENRASAMGSAAATQMLSAFSHPLYEGDGISVPAFYGMVAKRYLHENGLDRSHLAPIAIQSRANAARTPNAHKKDLITIEDVLNSRPIVEPLHLLDCCLISDGAGAVIVSKREMENDLIEPPVYLSGIGEKFTHEHLTVAPDIVRSGAHKAAQKAFYMAGITPSQIDFAELYDCFTVTPAILAEELGFAEKGQGWTMWSDGKAGIDGKFPINTHGSMLSHCHAGAAGGLLSVIECIRQVRGTQGDRQISKHDIGLAHTEGGIMSNHTTMIFTASPL